MNSVYTDLVNEYLIEQEVNTLFNINVNGVNYSIQKQGNGKVRVRVNLARNSKVAPRSELAQIFANQETNEFSVDAIVRGLQDLKIEKQYTGKDCSEIDDMLNQLASLDIN